jgi:hypothetical protein
MYGAIWRALPGPVWVRIILVLMLLAALLYSLVEWVFPWVDQFVAPQDATVEQ